MEQNSISDQILRLFDMLKNYVNMRIDYLKLGVAEYLIRFFSSLALWMVMFWILFFVLVFGSFAFAYWFGELTGKWSIGFLIIAGFYMVIAAVIYFLRKVLIVRPFSRLILHEMELDKFKDDTDEKE